MSRQRSTDRNGRSFSHETKSAVWYKGQQIPNFNPKEWMWDKCGQPIRWSDYGKTSKYGWEIDHIKPASAQGSDSLVNLQPLQWENNRTKSDQINWTCPVN